MQKTNFEFIWDFVELFQKDQKVFKEMIEKLFAFSLKGLTKRNNRDIKILLTDIQALGQPNQTYCDWRDDYNSLNAAQYDAFLTEGDNYAKMIKKMPIFLRAEKGRRRSKKMTKCLYRNIKKICIRSPYFLKNPDKDFLLGLKTGFFAYMEAIINIRRRLNFKLYNLVPSNLFITKNNKKYLIKDLYKEIIANNAQTYYQLDPSLCFSKEDIRNIQLEIYTYVFRDIYKRRL